MPGFDSSHSTWMRSFTLHSETLGLGEKIPSHHPPPRGERDKPLSSNNLFPSSPAHAHMCGRTALPLSLLG